MPNPRFQIYLNGKVDLKADKIAVINRFWPNQRFDPIGEFQDERAGSVAPT